MNKLQKTVVKLVDGSSWGSELAFKEAIARVPGAREIAEYVATATMNNECSDIYLEMRSDNTEAYIERVWVPEAWQGFVSIKDESDIFINLEAAGFVTDETAENTPETVEEANIRINRK